MKGERAWKIAALVLAVWALAASLNTLLSAPRHREILARKQADLRKILAHAGRWTGEDHHRAWLDEQRAWQPANLEELATRTLGAPAARISLRQAAPAAGGWQRREAAIAIADAPYDELALFLASAAEAPPAWRLREIELRPGTTAGRGAATLTLEALEKKQP